MQDTRVPGHHCRVCPHSSPCPVWISIPSSGRSHFARPLEPMTTVESEARRALTRLRRSLEKSSRELDALSAAIRHAEGRDFPVEAYSEAERHLEALLAFCAEEAQRLQEKILETGGLEPGRVRRSSST